MRSRPIVAIDGPAGAGKSTVARRLAEQLGFVLVDTGALYRTVALVAREANVSWDDAAEVASLATALVARDGLALQPGPQGLRVMVDGRDVSSEIRSPEVAMGASKVSAFPPVRAALLELQRAMGRAGGVVLEGRDIGTVVFPDAEVKFFLTASPVVRAQRRFAELQAKGDPATFDETLEDVKKRDSQDMQRVVAPLRPADDAVQVDSTGLALEEIIERMTYVVREKTGI